MIWSGSGLNWPRISATTRRASFPRATGRNCCSGFAARIRQGGRQWEQPHPRRSVAVPRRKRAMARKKDRRASDPVSATAVVMVLYITDSGPNSLRAVANLEAICKEHLQDNFRLEIIDVLEYPLRALADGIVVTPSLAKLSPLPTATVVGNLSDRSGVLRALGIVEEYPWSLRVHCRTRPRPARTPSVAFRRRSCVWSRVALSVWPSRRVR